MDRLLQGNLYWQLLQVVFRAKHGLLRLAEKHDLSLMQMITLCSLTPCKPEPINRLAALLACDASNATGLVDRLLTQGYIDRTENPKDRRVKMLTLTAKGEQLHHTILGEIASYDPGLLGNLTREEKQQLHKLVSKALDNRDNREHAKPYDQL